ncbi:ABC transporter permease [Pendulispora brunnea]|uniref:ABC transporter permease n=1 Tax=Pendulispora brunnea TaxID=2905690 RepID=A0ABZ2KJE7_9BACT
MFDSDALAEIWSTLTRHKLRTLLTAFSVGWGVFMLIVLLGAGRGLENGSTDGFRGDAANSIWIQSGITALPFAGQKPGRRIKLDNADYLALLALRPGVEFVDAELELSGNFTIRHGARHSSFRVRGAVPDVRFLENIHVREGRQLNDRDLIERRKVAVIGAPVLDILFGKQPPVGEHIWIRGSNFRVVGVYEDAYGNEDDQRAILVPLSTVQLLNGTSSELGTLGITVSYSDAQAVQALLTTTQELLAGHHHFAKEDARAVRSFNNIEHYSKVTRIFVWLRVFIWMVGIGTLLAGIVGVSNIMLISVKERTQEIGIRRAVGASPSAIVRMIVGESLTITALAGYLGLAAGIGVLGLANEFLPHIEGLRDPAVSFEVAFGATVLIVAAGTLAGLFPARRAVQMRPITALRNE